MIPGAKRVMMDVTANRTKEGEPACPDQGHTLQRKTGRVQNQVLCRRLKASLGEDQDKWDEAQKWLYQIHDSLVAGTEHQGGDGQQKKQLGARVQLDAFLACCYCGV